MLEYVQNGYGHGQQSYAVHEESWASDNEYHHGAELVCPPVMGSAPKLSKHQTMSHGSQTMYNEDDYGWKAETKPHNHGCNGEKMHKNAGWNGSNTKYGYSMPPNMSPDAHMGSKMSTYQVPMGSKISPYGGRYQENMKEVAEHEVYYKVNGPSHMKSEGMRYYEGGKHGSNGHFGLGYDDERNYQSVEWEVKGL